MTSFSCLGDETQPLGMVVSPAAQSAVAGLEVVAHLASSDDIFELVAGENEICGEDRPDDGLPFVCIPHDSLCSRHAVVEVVEDDRMALVRHRRGKTAVDGKLCRPRFSSKLKDGGLVEFGDVSFRFRWGKPSHFSRTTIPAECSSTLVEKTVELLASKGKTNALPSAVQRRRRRGGISSSSKRTLNFDDEDESKKLKTVVEENIARRRPPMVVVTGFQISSKAKANALAAFGGKEAARLRDATHICIKDAIKRTPKFLAAISVAKHVVKSEWLYASEAARTPLDPEQYRFEPSEAEEKRWNFSLEKTLASEERALEGYAVAVVPGAREAVKLPADDELRQIVECASGVFLSKLPKNPPGPSWPKGLLAIATPDFVDAPTPGQKNSSSSSSTTTDDDDNDQDKEKNSPPSPRDALLALPPKTLLGLVTPDDLFGAILRKRLDPDTEVMPFLSSS